MQSTLKGRLDALFANNNQRAVSDQHGSDASFSREVHFTHLFEEARSRLIRPRMEELALFLSGRFIATQITTNERRYDQVGRLIGSVGITLRAFVNASPTDPIGSVPHYAVYWEPVNLIARFYRNSHASRLAGELVLDGKAAVHEITSDLIEDKLLRFVKAIS